MHVNKLYIFYLYQSNINLLMICTIYAQDIIVIQEKLFCEG